MAYFDKDGDKKLDIYEACDIFLTKEDKNLRERVMKRNIGDFIQEYPDHVEFQMASILFFEIDLLAQLEALKLKFVKIQDFSHIEMFKEIDEDNDGEVGVSDILSFM